MRVEPCSKILIQLASAGGGWTSRAIAKCAAGRQQAGQQLSHRQLPLAYEPGFVCRHENRNRYKFCFEFSEFCELHLSFNSQ
jgi:hypothetical protein